MLWNMNWIDLYPLVAPLLAMSIGQLYKIIRQTILEKKLQLATFKASGGMPSSHSALMSALSTAMALKEGVFSSFFYICLIVSFVIIYDAMGVRRSAGEQAVVLNQITQNRSALAENLGHTPCEVFVGIILGIVSSSLLYWCF